MKPISLRSANNLVRTTHKLIGFRFVDGTIYSESDYRAYVLAVEHAVGQSLWWATVKHSQPRRWGVKTRQILPLLRSGMRQNQIARKLRVSRQLVSQVKQRAEAILDDHLREVEEE